jgi:hypothetical protein
MRNGLAGFVGGIVGTVTVLAFLSGRGPQFTSLAHAAAPSAANPGGLIAFTSPAEARGQQFLYVVDTRQQVFCLYRLDEPQGTIRLEAARNFGWDLKFEEFNNDPPKVDAIKGLLSQGKSSPE